MSRGWKGRHHRNWVTVCVSTYYRDEYEVMREEDSRNYGVFGVIGYDDEWHVIWRPNRNHTTDYGIDVMSNRVKYVSIDTYRDEAAVYKTFDEAVDSISTRWQDEFQHPEKRKRYRPRDSQKTKVYRWEHRMANEIGAKEDVEGWHRPVSVLERKREHSYLHTFLDEVCLEMGVDRPVLKFRTGGTHSFGGIEIELLPSHCTHTVLLHELSHILHKKWGRKTNGQHHQAHGKEFVGIFAYMFIRFGGIDKDAIVGHARQSKVNLLLPEQYWTWAQPERKRA